MEINQVSEHNKKQSCQYKQVNMLITTSVSGFNQATGISY